MSAAPEVESPAASAPGPKKPRKRRGFRNPGFFADRHQEYKKVDDFSCFNGGKFEFSYTPIKKAEKTCVCHFKAAMDAITIKDGMTLDTGLKIKSNEVQLVLACCAWLVLYALLI